MSDTTPDILKFKLVNVYEPLVREAVREVIASTEDFCDCEKCFLDICAIVLNKSKLAHYVTSYEGEALTNALELNHAKRVEVRMAAVDAVKRVKANPYHFPHKEQQN